MHPFCPTTSPALPLGAGLAAFHAAILVVTVLLSHSYTHWIRKEFFRSVLLLSIPPPLQCLYCILQEVRAKHLILSTGWGLLSLDGAHRCQLAQLSQPGSKRTSGILEETQGPTLSSEQSFIGLLHKMIPECGHLLFHKGPSADKMLGLWVCLCPPLIDQATHISPDTWH